MKMFEVGGCVRDEIMGRESNDIDFTVVLEPSDVPAAGTAVGFDPYEFMNGELERLGFKIFLRTPEFLTTRAQFPKGERATVVDSSDIKKGYKSLTADFVLARKEGEYTDGRRPDIVRPGTLEDDLARRDFSMNAIAKDGEDFIDPFNGRQDINEGVIRAVGKALDRLTEDALRAVRALRFHVTLGFRIDHDLMFAMQTASVLDKIAGTQVSDERIKDELNKMFKANPIASIMALNKFPALTAAMFNGRVNLEATMKQKGFN
jgi:tRNA nucleotidyltransferase/poly(A) polymerase